MPFAATVRRMRRPRKLTSAGRLPPTLHIAAHDLRRELRNLSVYLAETIDCLQVGSGELPDVRRSVRCPLYPGAATGVFTLADQGQFAAEFAEDSSIAVTEPSCALWLAAVLER